MKPKKLISYLILIGLTTPVIAQDITLFQQFNGRYDYIAIGNTLNTVENGPFSSCNILTSSSATLNLNTNQTVVAAYLYWAGSGTGDFDIELNGSPITAERTFSDALDNNRVFFAAFADITTIVLNESNTVYTVSQFDLTNVISPYCPTGTNFGGWAITIIYEDNTLPLNQLNVYDGLQSVPQFLSITLDNLNVLDNEGAKIGFVAWEGDRALAVNEQLNINGNVISNLPLNPANNAFNGTNSYTGATDLYNMDIDVYNIQNNINIGDTTAEITLSSGQDFVMINNIITVLNSQLPDATINITDYVMSCNDNTIELTYTISNLNSTAAIPENTPIAFYNNGNLIAQSTTLNSIAINTNESNTILLNITETFNINETIIGSVDDDGTQTGVVSEIDENNNTDEILILKQGLSELKILPNILACNKGFDSASFNLYDALSTLNINFDTITFYNTSDDLESETNAIVNPELYSNFSNPESIFVRLDNTLCYELFQFQLKTENCPPRIPQGFSPNNDGINDWFNIQGLYNIFTAHELKIYNRYGTLIFEGNNENPWLGNTNRGINGIGNRVPVGTYYYILNLNYPNYKPYMGWIYVNY